MDHGELAATLGLLKKGREKLVADFTLNDVELFSDFFRYESSQALMALAMDRFNVSWISYHYELFDDLSKRASSAMGAAFKDCILRLIEHFERSHQDNRSAEWALVKSLIDEKKDLLAGQFDFSNKDDVRYKKLVFSRHKEKALFERIFAQALGEKK